MDELADSTACDGMPDDNINISDVIEVIETDPDFNPSPSSKVKMYNGGEQARRSRPTCVIVEQPASKALRFRYECEGRSAGSIPGANSTPENKTFPTIRIQGYQGRAVVVVSCVTKDPPYRPHPHNLVGREGCKKGVCTLEVPPETMTVTFSNLGIQCVKKKDIEAALRVREGIKVDPFRSGYSHRNQPTSIDLNAVRLCFQVFIPVEGRSRFTDLAPVVSDPIYDKKAMSDLVIVKLSDCVSPVDGGNKDIILLCEKVAKEDIQVRFYEEKDGLVVWEGLGEFQPSQVHKQTAIWFKPPKYRTMDVREPVKVNIQLRRPSDGATSVPVPYQLLPLDAGRPAYWSLRRSFAKKRNYDIFSDILAQDTHLISNRLNLVTQAPKPPTKSVTVETQTSEYAEMPKQDNIDGNKNEEKDLNELVDQVVELDEIYAENKKLQKLNGRNDCFDDTKSYSSLQLAFKNPLDIADNSEKYEDVVIPESPLISVGSKVEEEKLPPLPPKRAKKTSDSLRTSGSKIITDISDPSESNNFIQTIGSSHSMILSTEHKNMSLQRPKSQNDLSPPVKQLPPTPCSTLPKPKKRKFLSGLFSYLSKTTANDISPSKRNSFSSSKSLQTPSLNRTPSNVSERSASIHIPLKASTDDLNQNHVENPSVLGDALDFNLDLTEAEHYALYTAIAPHATQSEFDETSCYYAPVEGGKVLGEADIQMKLESSKT